MPIHIGTKAHDFSDPTGLMSDCHRRIEMFLGSLQRVAKGVDRPLTNEAHAAFESALRYFNEAAPKHTADEEVSLFPRLRQIDEPAVESAISTLDALEDDHRRADALHAEVHALGLRCLEQGHLSAGEAGRFRQAVSDLASVYAEHIRIEDEIVFPVAKRILSDGDKSAIAKEMASRRNIAK